MEEQTYRLALELRNRLRDELAQNETFRAFQHVEAIVSMWEQSRRPTVSVQSVTPAAVPRMTPAPLRVASVVTRHFAGSQTSKIVSGATEFLKRTGRRAPASEIYKDLVAQGIKVGGKNPQKSTASYLSHSPHFDNVPGQGYGLIEWSASEAQTTETPGSSELSGAPGANGATPLSP
jgi:hypothetical protein